MIKNILSINILRNVDRDYVSSSINFKDDFHLHTNILNQIGNELEIITNTFRRWEKEISQKKGAKNHD